MELRHLRYFIAIAEERHITRAAERLGLQQPPLSRQLKAIEREMGVQLFRRKPRGVELTDAGQAFLKDARAMLSHLDHAFDAARRTARGEQGQLSIGYTNATAFHPLAPRVICEFREAFPLVSVSLAESQPDDLIEGIRRDQIDLAFIGGAIGGAEGLAIDLLLEEPMVVALPAKHVLASGKNDCETALSLKALAGETFIVFGRPNGALTAQSNAVVAACQQIGFTPRVGHVVPNNLSRLNLVAAGLGIAIVAASLRRMNIYGVVYRRLTSAAKLKIPINLASRRAGTSEVIRQFRSLAKRTARSFERRSGKEL